MIFLKRTLPVVIAFVTGVWFAVQFFVPATWSQKSLEHASNWVKIVSGFAFALGVYSLCHLHWRRIRTKQAGWGYSLLVYVGLLSTLYVGLSGEVRKFFEILLRRSVAHHVYALGRDEGTPEGVTVRTVRVSAEEAKEVGAEAAPAVVGELVAPDGKVVGYSFDPNVFHANIATGRVPAAEAWLARRGIRVLAGGTEEPPASGATVARQQKTFAWYAFASYQGYEANWGSLFTWQFNYVYNAAQQSMFSMLGFFIASAAYRTFRARTWQAALLLVAALIVIFGRTTLAGYAHDYFPEVAEWIMYGPNLAAKRGIMLGVALGAIATSLRIIFGIERAYLGGE